ncbi:MAG: hypothetical protein KKI02_12140, partial [Planctomycetes bacterium]|nr:hypothetical protein [Planctomycetota bacterium]
GMLGAEVSQAQQPTVRARRCAALGPDSRVTEPGLAAGPDNVVAVFYDLDTYRAWYGAYNMWTRRWTEGEIDPNTPYQYIVDLSIAHDAHDGGHMAAAKAGARILTCRFVQDPSALKGDVMPLGWVIAQEHEFAVDKPWIVAGDPNLEDGQEYYVVYQVDFGGAYHYLHSLDGGQTWYPETISVDGQPVTGGFCAQPAVYQDGPLYVAYISGGTIYFLVGEDQPSGAVAFARLLRDDTTYTEPLPLSIPLASPVIREDVPGNFPIPVLSTVPYLAVDPGNPDRLFIAYHDTATSDPNDRDVNVYVHEIIRDDTIWEVGDRIKVNNDDTLYESDQFMPEIIVDTGGYVHILFYDDRRFTDGPGYDLQPDDGCPRPKFDAYYAWAPVDNLDFEEPGRNLLLYLTNPSDPNEPAAFDRTLAPGATPREYNGIAWYGDRIWTAYTGMWADDPDNKTVIWSSGLTGERVHPRHAGGRYRDGVVEAPRYGRSTGHPLPVAGTRATSAGAVPARQAYGR